MTNDHEENGKRDDNGQGPHRLIQQPVHFHHTPFRGQAGHEGIRCCAHGLAEQPHENKRDPEPVIEGCDGAPGHVGTEEPEKKLR